MAEIKKENKDNTFLIEKHFFEHHSAPVFFIQNKSICFQNQKAYDFFGTLNPEETSILMLDIEQFPASQNFLKTHKELNIKNKKFDCKIEIHYLKTTETFIVIVNQFKPEQNIIIEHLKRQLLLEKKKNILNSGYLKNIISTLQYKINNIINHSQKLKNLTFDLNLRNNLTNKILDDSGDMLTQMNQMQDYLLIKNDQFKLEYNTCNLNGLLREIISNTNKNEKETPLFQKIELTEPSDKQDLIIDTDEIRLKQIIKKVLAILAQLNPDADLNLILTSKANQIELQCMLTANKFNHKKILQLKNELLFSEGEKMDSMNNFLLLKKTVSLFKGELNITLLTETKLKLAFSFPFKQANSPQQKNMTRDITKLNWKDKTILIVDDFEPVFLYLEEALSQTQVTYKYVQNGRDSIEMCKTNKIDLVLMDIQLPDINGIEAVKEIKKTNPDIYFIAQTAYNLDQDKTMILEEGLDDYLSKPIDIEELLTKIDAVFNPQ